MEAFRDAGTSREFAEAVCTHYKADDTDLKEIPSPAQQRAFVQNLDTNRTEDVFKRLDDEEGTGILRAWSLPRK